MKKNIIYFIVFLFIIMFVSCTQNDIVGANGISTQFNEDISFRSAPDVDCGRFDERGCLVDEETAGIMCIKSVGKSCKREHACEALSEYDAEEYFTPAELNDWMNVDYRQNRLFMLHMWEIGEFIHPDSIQ